MPRHVFKKIANSEIHWIASIIHSRELNKIYRRLTLGFPWPHYTYSQFHYHYLPHLQNHKKKYQMLNFTFKLKYKRKT